MEIPIAWLILGLRPANDRRRCLVTTSLIGWLLGKPTLPIRCIAIIVEDYGLLTKILFKEIHLNIVCRMAAILSRFKYVNPYRQA